MGALGADNKLSAQRVPRLLCFLWICEQFVRQTAGDGDNSRSPVCITIARGGFLTTLVVMSDVTLKSLPGRC